jgi:hypothetical protein
MPTHDEATQALDVLLSWVEFATLREDRAESTLRAYIEQAKADAVDAARYRMWRDQYVSDGDDTDMLMALSNAWSPEEVDRCIDIHIAARSAKPGETR